MTTSNWQGVQACTVVDTVGPNGVPMHGEPADQPVYDKTITIAPPTPFAEFAFFTQQVTTQPPHAEGAD